MGRLQVTDQDRTEARRLLLGWLTDDDGDIDQLGSAAFEMHVPHHTFPGEDFMGLAIGALDLAGIDRGDPIVYETLLADHLPEIEFRGKEHRKIPFAVLANSARRAGLEPDLLDEIRFWRDDFWHYALFAAIALIRAAATKTNQPVSQLAHQLAHLHALDPPSPQADLARPSSRHPLTPGYGQPNIVLERRDTEWAVSAVLGRSAGRSGEHYRSSLSGLSTGTDRGAWHHPNCRIQDGSGRRLCCR